MNYPGQCACATNAKVVGGGTNCALTGFSPLLVLTLFAFASRARVPLKASIRARIDLGMHMDSRQRPESMSMHVSDGLRGSPLVAPCGPWLARLSRSWLI